MKNVYNKLKISRYKFVVADAIVDHINPIRLKMDDYLQNPDYLWNVLSDGNEKAREVAEKTMDEVKAKVGLGNFDRSAYAQPLKDRI